VSSFDPDELRRLLRSQPSSPEAAKPLESLKVKPEGVRVAVSKQITDEKGNVLYEERDETAINPWTAQPERKVVYATRKCEGCGLPLTAEILSTDQVKPCILCGKVTCPRCRVNTEVTEYLKPEVRGSHYAATAFTLSPGH